MKYYGHTFNLGDSKEELKKLPSQSADLIFLDGDHTLPYVRAEFTESLRIIRKNGIICLHDYNSWGVKFWVDFIGKYRRFSTMVFNTSENRGIAVVICHKPKPISSLAMSWFNATRSDFAIKVRDKLRKIKRQLTGGNKMHKIGLFIPILVNGLIGLGYILRPCAEIQPLILFFY